MMVFLGLPGLSGFGGCDGSFATFHLFKSLTSLSCWQHGVWYSSQLHVFQQTGYLSMAHMVKAKTTGTCNGAKPWRLWVSPLHPTPHQLDTALRWMENTRKVRDHWVTETLGELCAV